MEAATEQAPPFAQWAILELMGHRRLAGFISEQQIAGAAFLRIDVARPVCDVAVANVVINGGVLSVYCKREPQHEGDHDATVSDVIATQLYAPAAVYAITPCTEETARRSSALSRVEPVHEWELPRLDAGREQRAAVAPGDPEYVDADIADIFDPDTDDET